jgi:hypothetical protein
MRTIPVRFTVAASLMLAVGNICSSAQTGDASHGLTPELRTNFLAGAETTLRAQAKVAADFWDWLDQHPQIRAGLLSAEEPAPAEFAENLDGLRHALGTDTANRYANLLLGVSLGQKITGGGDGAYLATALSSSTEPESDPRVKKVADYLKQKNLSVVDFIAKQDAIFSELGIDSLKKKENNEFINHLALATGTFPPHQNLPLAEELKKVIAHYETKLPPFADKGPEWPLFPLDTAPWPLLAPMRQTISDRELDYLWNRFQGKMPEAGAKRLVTYSQYTWNYEKPEVRYKQSEWFPSAIPRIIEDGGVCGRQSTLAQLSQVGLGRPAVGMYQPGHRALLSYRFDGQSGNYSVVREQSITSPDKSTCQWYLPPAEGPRAKGNVGVEYHVALALAMNNGLDRYTDSRIAFLLAQKKSGDEQRALLESAVNLNPFNLDAWFALAKIAGNDTAAVNQLLERLDKLMAAPNSGLAEETELAADTDLSHHAAPTADSRRDANLVATQVGDAIAEAAYAAVIADKNKLAQNRANLRAEMLRRANLKLPHGPAVQGLVYRYDIAAEGPVKTELAVAAEVKAFAEEKPGKRKQQADAVRQHVGFVLAALPKATERVTWLNGLCAGFPAAARFQVGKEGKATPDALYGYLHEELLIALKATGAKGTAESKRLAAEFESTRASLETKAGKT